MNIKSLLIGSAAAVIAVSGARAADAVMAPEPEPVEYVRICDAYGNGFFYIPGTETCLRISGYVWYQLGAGGYEPGSVFGIFDEFGTETASYHYGVAAQDGWVKSVRARVNFDARSETEWGTLRSYIRFQASWNGVGDGPVAADQAYIELGGWKMGYSESFWVDSGNGGASNYGSHSWTGMYYGYQQRALIGYRFDSNGFFGAISLEDDALTGDGYMPDVVAKLGYGGGWGAVWAKVAYDESALDGFAAQLGAQFNIPNVPGSSLRLIGFWAEGVNAYNVGGPNALFNGLPIFAGAEWSVLVSYNHQFSPTLGASIGFQWFNDFYSNPANPIANGLVAGGDGWAAEVSVVWFPVRDFEVRAEVAYQDVGSYLVTDTGETFNPSGSVSGFLRFTRYF